jgi:hypothetical protein
MTALGINFSSRDIDRFYWSKPSTHGKPEELTRIQNQIDRLSARYIRMCDVEPLPVVDLEELDDEIKQLEKVKKQHRNISNARHHQKSKGAK